MIKTSGTLTISATVTDTRGRTATNTKAITVLPYFNPAISKMAAWRITPSKTASNDGERLALQLKYAIAPVGNSNDKAYAIKYRKSTESSYTLIQEGTEQYAFDSTLYFTDGPEFSTDYAYVIRVEVTDYFTTVSYEATIPTAATIFDVHNSGKGFAFGKVAETENLLDIAWQLKSAGHITSGGNIIAQRNAWPSLELRDATGNSQAQIYASDSIGTLGLPLVLRAYNAAGAYNNYKFPAPASGGATSNFDILKVIKISVSGVASYTSISENWSAFPNDIFACSVSATSPPFSGVAFGYKTGQYGAYVWMDYNTGIKHVRMNNGTPVVQ